MSATTAPIIDQPAPPRRHPDVFTAEEAVAYLHLEGEGSLDWLVGKSFLRREKVGRVYLYHREDLDACARLMFGKEPELAPLRSAGRRAS
jgi:hypothetical protein